MEWMRPMAVADARMHVACMHADMDMRSTHRSSVCIDKRMYTHACWCPTHKVTNGSFRREVWAEVTTQRITEDEIMLSAEVLHGIADCVGYLCFSLVMLRM